MNERTQALHDLIKEHNLSSRDVAELLGRTEQTVRHWRTESSVRPIPQDALELLKFKLKERATGNK